MFLIANKVLLKKPLRFQGSFFMDIEPLKIRVTRPFETPGTTNTAKYRLNTEEPSARGTAWDPRKSKELSVLLTQYVHKDKQQTLSLAQGICIRNKKHDGTYTELLVDTDTSCWLSGMTATLPTGMVLTSTASVSVEFLWSADWGI